MPNNEYVFILSSFNGEWRNRKWMAEIEVKNVEPIISKLVPNGLFDQLQTSEEGLTTKEAESRLEQYGQNTIKEKQSKSLLLQLLSNFTSMMAILLWISGSIAFIGQNA